MVPTVCHASSNIWITGRAGVGKAPVQRESGSSRYVRICASSNARLEPFGGIREAPVEDAPVESDDHPETRVRYRSAPRLRGRPIRAYFRDGLMLRDGCRYGCIAWRARGMRSPAERGGWGHERSAWCSISATAHVSGPTPTLSATFVRRVQHYRLDRLTLHGLRHTWATLALEQGIHPRVVQERLGHSTIAITLGIYSHVAPTLHDEAAEAVAGVLFKP